MDIIIGNDTIPTGFYDLLSGARVSYIFRLNNLEAEQSDVKYDEIKRVKQRSIFIMKFPLVVLESCVRDSLRFGLIYDERIRKLGEVRWIVSLDNISSMPRDQPCRMIIAVGEDMAPLLEVLEEFDQILELEVRKITRPQVNIKSVNLPGIEKVKCKKLTLKCKANLSNVLKSEYIESLSIKDVAAIEGSIENNYTLLDIKSKNTRNEIDQSLIFVLVRNRILNAKRRFIKTKVAPKK